MSWHKTPRLRHWCFIWALSCRQCSALAHWDDSSLFLQWYCQPVMFPVGHKPAPRHPWQCPTYLFLPYGMWLLTAVQMQHSAFAPLGKNILLGRCFQSGILNTLPILLCAQALCYLRANQTWETVGVIAQLGPWALLNKSDQWEAFIQWIGCRSDSLRSLVLFVPLNQCSVRQAITYS